MVARTFTFPVTSASNYLAGKAAELSSGQFSSSNLATGIGIHTPIGYNGTADAAPLRMPFVAAHPDGGTLTDWNGKSHWDADRNEWWYCAGTTGAHPGSLTMICYTVGTNTWRHWQGATHTDAGVSVKVDPGGAYTGAPHNFESAGFCPIRRKIYRQVSDPDTYRAFLAFDIDAKTSVRWPAPSLSQSGGFWNGEVFPELGSYCVFYHESQTQIGRLSLDTGAAQSSFSKTAAFDKPALCYYNNAIYYTGDGTAFWRFNFDGSSTPRAALPTPMNANGNYDLNFTTFAQIGGMIYAFKLSVGATGRGIYRFNPDTNAWSTMTTTIPFTMSSANGTEERFIVGPIRSLGVAMLIVNPNGADAYTNAVYLWKP
jgi:hypothetical protein